MQLFCRHQLKRQRSRARYNFQNHNYLHRYCANSFTDRLSLIKRQFETILITGFVPESFIRDIYKLYPKAQILYSSPFLDAGPVDNSCLQVYMEDESYPFTQHSFDLILSNLTLHWVNDIPGVLSQMRYLLKPEGFFLASIFGERTLQELRHSFVRAEGQILDGISARFAPLVDLNTASNLLMRAGFSLPVADYDHLTVMYPNLLTLMKEVRGMGEGNALVARPKTFSPRQLFSAAERAYREQFRTVEGLLPATFDILYLTGWNEGRPT